MMNREQIFSIWAPSESPWSRWVKPVLFAFLDPTSSPISSTEFAYDWCPPASERVALVFDLPSAEGVLAGIEVATKGFRPIPLYNAVPLPLGLSSINSMTGQSVAAVNVYPILNALSGAAEKLKSLNLPPNAPPAFLLDANRSGGGRILKPEEFDNRSVSFTTDFPSAIFLASWGIERVILVQRSQLMPQPDLAHSFRRWQDAGFKLECKRIDLSGPAAPLVIARPSWYGAMFQRALAGLGLRRSSKGGFGAWVPAASSGG